MVATLSSKEFKQNTYKYLKPGEYLITNHEVATLKVVITVATNEVATKKPKEVATEKDPDLCQAPECGFKAYKDGLCMKHGKLG